jgi:hypothetical protein
VKRDESWRKDKEKPEGSAEEEEEVEVLTRR